MVQYYNTGDKDSTNLIAYASDLSMFAMLFTDMQNGTRDYGNDRPIVALRTKRKIFSYKIQKPLLKRNLKKDA